LANIDVSDPVAGYLDDLLHECAADNTDPDPWNRLLQEVVTRHGSRRGGSTDAAIDEVDGEVDGEVAGAVTVTIVRSPVVSTLRSGMAMIPLMQAGCGSRVQRHTQFLVLLETARQLPRGRVHRAVILAAQACKGSWLEA
jgi:hypothetical protein